MRKFKTKINFTEGFGEQLELFDLKKDKQLSFM